MHVLWSPGWLGWTQWTALGLGCVEVHLIVTSWLTPGGYCRRRRSSLTLATLAFLVSAAGGVLGLMGRPQVPPTPSPYGDQLAHHLALAFAEALADVGFGVGIFVFCSLLSIGLPGQPPLSSLPTTTAAVTHATVVRSAVACVLVMASLFLMATADFNGPLGVIKVRLSAGWLPSAP